MSRILDTSWFATFRAMFAQGTVAEIGAVAYTVYSCIKSHADFNDGLSIPSQKDIIRETGLSERAVQKALKILEAAGLIERRRDWKRNVYRLQERLMVEDKQAVISFPYLPAVIRQARQEIHKFLLTGDFAGAKIVHIERLEVNINIVQENQDVDFNRIPDPALRELMRKIVTRTRDG